MTDILSLLFTNNDFLSFVGIITFNLAWVSAVIVAKKGKRKVPVKLFLLMTFLWFGFLVNQGLISSSYLIIYIFVTSGLITYVYSEQFAKGVANSQKIFISYLVFFASAMWFESLMLATSTAINVGVVPPTNQNCSGALAFLTCSYNTIKYFLSFFGASSSIAIVNSILITTFIAFVALYIAGFFRGVNQ